MKRPTLAKPGFNIALAVLLIGFGFGINATYQNYKGTGLSRLPQDSLPTPGQSSMAVGISQQLAHASGPAGGVRVTSPTFANEPHSNTSTGRVVDELKLYPSVQKGMRTPFDLWNYYGRGTSSFSSPVLPMRFEQWLDFHRKQKPQLMKDVRSYMEG